MTSLSSLVSLYLGQCFSSSPYLSVNKSTKHLVCARYYNICVLYVCMWVNVLTWAQVWKPEISIRYLLRSFSPLLLRWGSLLNLELIWLDWLTRKLHGSIYFSMLSPQSWGYRYLTVFSLAISWLAEPEFKSLCLHGKHVTSWGMCPEP